MQRILHRAAVAAMFLAAACGDDDSPPGGGGGDPDASVEDDTDAAVNPTACEVTPGVWTAPQFAANAAESLALRAALDALAATKMRGAEQENPAHVVDELSDLTVLYEAGTPSLATIAHAGVDPIVDDAFADFVALIAVGPLDVIDASDDWTPGASGGIAGTGTRGLNAGGLEVRQLVDKGIFAGGFYRYAIGLTEGAITDATIDAIAAVWGSNADLATDGVGPLAPQDSANYSFRMGFHTVMAQALADAKAYAADENCTAERDAALVTFFRNWEQSMVARTVHYANICAENFTNAAALDDNLRIAGLHELSEGVGLTLGFHGMPAVTAGPMTGPGRVITDAQIEALLGGVGINVTDLGGSTSGDGMEDPAAFTAGQLVLEATGMTVYGWTAEQIAIFHDPPVGGG